MGRAPVGRARRRRSSLLFVCHGNMCRSPMAELLARLAFNTSQLGEARIVVASAGTHAQEAAPMHPHALLALSELGLDGSKFRSRQLSVDHLANADVILAATREQRAMCAQLCPPVVKRVFTIRQFGRLASAVSPACLVDVPPDRRLANLLDEVTKVRDQLQPVPAGHDDLADPVRGTINDMYICLQEIQQSLRPVLSLIGTT